MLRTVLLLIAINFIMVDQGAIYRDNYEVPETPLPVQVKVDNWKNIRSVEDVCNSYPERMNYLMGSLNLDLRGLEAVKEAYIKGNIPRACELLLLYYKNGTTAQYLRKVTPPLSGKRDSEADSVLNNIFTFYNQPDRIPHDADGHLDWRYRGPTDDIEWAWALNRHYHISLLFNAFMKTGNPDYSKAIDRDLKDWLISSLPYPAKRSSTELWRGLEVSFRVKIWSRIFYALMNDETLTPATRLLMLSSLPDHAHYARNFHAQGNWLTMEISGLATVATAWPEFKESPAWLEYSKETMTKSLAQQVYPDGVQTELTSSYHQVALDNFNQFRELCIQAKEPLPDAFENQIEKMWNYLAYTVRPDGYGLLNNDADLIYNRERIKKSSDTYHRQDWLYIATNGKEGIKPEGPPSNIFPYAGHFIMRSGYDPDAQWAFFDIGPWGTGHQHNDKLHISISAYGHDLLVDCGRFSYRGEVADKFRSYACGSFGHNVILVDGKGQAPGSLSVNKPLSIDHFKISDDFDYAWSSFDRFTGLEGSFKHNRSLFYVRGKYWIIVDSVTTDRPRKIETLWHWHPDCKVLTGKNNIVLSGNERGNLEVIPLGSVKWNVTLVRGMEKPSPQGWYSKEYNSAVPSTASIYSCEIKGSSAFVWILYPFLKDQPAIKATIISQDDKGIKVRVKDSGGQALDIFIPYSDSSLARIMEGV